MNYRLIFLSFLFIFFSCSNDNKIINNKRSKKTITELEIVSNSIELAEDYLNNYYTQTLFNNDGNELAKDKYPLSGGGVLKAGLLLINDSSDKEPARYERLEYDIIKDK